MSVKYFFQKTFTNLTWPPNFWMVLYLIFKLTNKENNFFFTLVWYLYLCNVLQSYIYFIYLYSLYFLFLCCVLILIFLAYMQYQGHWKWCQLWSFYTLHAEFRCCILEGMYCADVTSTDGCRSVWFGWQQRNQLNNLTDGFSTGENSTNFPVIYYYNSIGNWFLLIKIAHKGN